MSQEELAKEFVEKMTMEDVVLVSSWTNWYAFRSASDLVYIVDWNVMIGKFEFVKRPSRRVLDGLKLWSV